MDLDLLTAFSPEIISSQATINIGTIGHVTHGKSTLVECLSSIKTAKFGEEKEKNMTIKLGYANAKIFECDNQRCPRLGRYRATGSNSRDAFPCDRTGCNGQFRLKRHVSFVDCPGHDAFMASMLNGTAIMDAAILVIAANEHFPRPQTAEHLAATQIANINPIIIVQNKIDLINRDQAKKQYGDIMNFIQGTNAEKAPIIPVSAQYGCNIDVLCEFLVTKIPMPIRDFTSKPKMTIIRSFDINKPGAIDVDKLKGGVVGGSILKGILKIDQEIEIRPGIIMKDGSGEIICRPVKSKVVSLFAEQNQLSFAVPGGLIGVGTNIDPTLCRSDRLVGHVLGEVDHLPKIYKNICIKYFLLRRLLGVSNGSSQNNDTKISKLQNSELLLINIGSLSTGGRVLRTKNNVVEIQLTKPVCAELSEKVAISRRINSNFRLIGWGEIVSGAHVPV